VSPSPEQTNSLPQLREHGNAGFPCPAEGERCEITPPGFYWLPVAGVREYRVLVEDEQGATVIDERRQRCCLLPRAVLPPGRYRWQVLADDGRERGWWPFQIADDAIEQVVPSAEEVLERIPDQRPRHLYLPEDLPVLRERHPRALAVLQRNIDAALADGPPPRPRFHRDDGEHGKAPRYREAFDDHRDFGDHLVACALGHLLLNDERAADYARSALLDIADWNPLGPCSVSGEWGDEIGLTNARLLGTVYDWTAELFDERQRRYLEQTIACYARQVHDRLLRGDFFGKPGDSHAGRLPAYLGEAAMWLKGSVDHDEARDWLQIALDIHGSFFPHYGDADGGWAQGTFYASSYTKWYLPFFMALERHCGFSFLDRPFYRRLSQFFTHFAPPGWECFPFCDGYWVDRNVEEFRGFMAQNPFRVYAERFGPELARQHAQTLAEPERYHLHLLDVFTLPWQPQGDAGALTQSRRFRGAGFASLHSRIEEPADDTAVLVRASRYGATSHQHADQGNVAIISRGRGLLTPSGFFGRGYGSPHHKEWTRRTLAHNCLLLDGEGQIEDFTAIGDIDWIDDDGVHAWCSCELSTAYRRLRHYRRRVHLIRPQLVLIDDVLALHDGDSAAVSWLAHSYAAPEADADGGVQFHREPASLRLIVQHRGDDELAYQVGDRWEPHPNDGVPDALQRRYPPQWHLRWTAERAATQRFVAIAAVNEANVAIQRRGSKLELIYERMAISTDLATDEPLDVKQLD